MQAAWAACSAYRHTRNLQKRFQRFGMLRHLCAGVPTHLGQGLGLLRVESLPGVDPNLPSGLIFGFDGVEYAERRRRYEILLIFSQVCEKIHLEYVWDTGF